MHLLPVTLSVLLGAQRGCILPLKVTNPVLFDCILFPVQLMVILVMDFLGSGLLLVCGAFVNGPYALITTAVSAELGTQRALKGNKKALATVTSIIDGTGSIGEFTVAVY